MRMAADAALQNGDVVEAQKLKALGIRNSIEAEIGAAAAAAAAAATAASASAAAAAGITKQCDALAAESRKQKVREVKQQIVEEEEEVPIDCATAACSAIKLLTYDARRRSG
jgi:hypothetical protein